MKLTVNSKVMLAAVMAAARVINGKNAMPICDCVKMWQSEDGRWWVTGGDGEKQATVVVGVNEQEGEAMTVCIHAQTLVKSLSALPDAPMTMDVKDGMVVVKCGKGKYKIPYVGADEYPVVMPVGEEGVTKVTVAGSLFVQNVKAGLAARAEDELRPQMSGVALDVKDGMVTFVASDGHMMYTYATEAKTEGEEKVIIIPSAVAKNVDAMFKACGEVTVTSDGKRLMIQSEGISIVSAVIEGRYPNYRTVIPDVSKSNSVVCNVKELVAALQRCSVFASDASKLAALKVESFDTLALEAEDIDFSTSGADEVGIQQTDCRVGFKIGVHIGHFVGLLRNVSSENVVLKVTDSNRPIVMLDEGESGMLELLMPMIIN